MIKKEQLIATAGRASACPVLAAELCCPHPLRMIEHLSLRCPDPTKSRAFYLAALKPLGYAQDMRNGDSFAFVHQGRHDFWVTPGKVGTPLHLAFLAASKTEVDAFHRAALKAGGMDNGAPGPRPDYGYAAFVLDPDGNNVEAVIWT